MTVISDWFSVAICSSFVFISVVMCWQDVRTQSFSSYPASLAENMKTRSECAAPNSNISELNFTTLWKHIFWLAVVVSPKPDCQKEYIPALTDYWQLCYSVAQT